MLPIGSQFAKPLGVSINRPSPSASGDEERSSKEVGTRLASFASR